MGKIICIANQKGGVGKTTTAVNLSASLAISKQRTLLIDIDPQGNASSGVGIPKEGIANTIYNVIIDNLELKEAIQETPFHNLAIVPSSIDLIGAEIELVNVEGREARLKEKLATINDHYDYIIIDCPPS